MAELRNSEGDKETELTMCDVLEEEKELEEDANAVLGGSDDKNCSYDQGYVPRQALYACKSCTVDGFAGICLACCYACHDGHEVVELYTKRNFRCDCGNSKFTDSKCTLNPNKEAVNSDNKYNHNFKGLYCTCSRPYPDPDDSIPDEMIQCVMCEDWYHGRHLEVDALPEDYFEMICSKCMDARPFLFPYLSKFNPVIDVVGDAPPQEDSKPPAVKCEDIQPVSSVKCEPTSDSKCEDFAQVSNVKCEEVTPASNGLSSNDETSKPCLLKKLEGGARVKGAAFWPDNWRKELCRCQECMNIYCNADCEFLLNMDDTIQAYEEKGKGSREESQYDQGLSALGQLDRVKQMEAIRAYTSMKGQLKEYLKEFADSKKTVRESDIKEFFERIGKKQKLNNGVPHFCR